MKLVAGILALLVLYSGLELVLARRAHLVIKSATCSKYNRILRIFECSFKPHPVEANTYVYAGRMLFTQTIEREFKLRLRLDISKPGKRRKTRVVDTTLDLCTNTMVLLRGTLEPIIAELLRTTNLPRKCPVLRDVNYIMDNFTASLAFFPTFAPEMNFTFGLDFLSGRIMYATQLHVGSYFFT